MNALCRAPRAAVRSLTTCRPSLMIVWSPNHMGTNTPTTAVTGTTPTTPITTTSVRFYRGQADEALPVLSEREQTLLQTAMPKADAIRARHLRLPDVADIPPGSLGLSSTTSGDMPDAINNSNDPTPDNLDIRRKRLIYRSKQRGWLEVDLLLGTWAHQNVPTLTADELDQYEAFVNLETIDIYNVITLRLDVPEHMKTPDGNGVVERIQAWARASPLGQADPEKYKQVKTDNKLI